MGRTYRSQARAGDIPGMVPGDTGGGCPGVAPCPARPDLARRDPHRPGGQGMKSEIS